MLTSTRSAARPPLALVFSITLTGIMGNSLIAPVLPDVLDDLGTGDAGAGIVVAATALPGIVVAPLVGLVADRLGRRAVLVPCLMLFGLAGVASALAPSFGVLIVARLIQGAGAAGLINLAVVLIGDNWEGTRRTALIGRNAAMLTIGLATFPLLSGALGDLTSWRVALTPQALGVVVGLWAWRRLDPARPPSAGTVREQLGGVGDVLRRPSILAILTSGVVLFVLIFGVQLATLPLHLERELGLSAGARGAMLSIPAVTASLVAFNLGRIRERLGLRTVMIGATVIFACSIALMGLTAAVVVVAVGSALYGLGDGVLIPILQDVAIEEAPAEHRGAVVAVWVGAVRLGQTIGPLLAAVVYTATDTGTALLAGSVLAVGLLAMIVLGPLARER